MLISILIEFENPGIPTRENFNILISGSIY
jgi:hypothetical protein